MTKEQQAALPNVLRYFKAPSELCAKLAIVDIKKHLKLSNDSHHVSYMVNIDDKDDVQLYIGGADWNRLGTRIAACQHILNHYGIK